MIVMLARGGNYVTYLGAEMPLQEALADIWDHVVGTYRYNRAENEWDNPTTIKPLEHWFIEVDQACTLLFFRWWVININEVVVAERAVPGATVPVEVLMYYFFQLAYPLKLTFACTGIVDGAYVDFPNSVECYIGATASVVGTFVMPDKNVTVTVWAFYWDGSDWVLDDWRQRTVQVEEEVTYAFTVGSPGVSAA